MSGMGAAPADMFCVHTCPDLAGKNVRRTFEARRT